MDKFESHRTGLNKLKRRTAMALALIWGQDYKLTEITNEYAR